MEGKMPSVLIVDDAMVMRKTLKSILERAGYNVVDQASNGLEAYQKYAATIPDFVTMDIGMPEINGIQATQKILEGFPDAKIIMISAMDEKAMVMEALRQGAKHYILKPVTYEKVLQVFEKVGGGETASDVSEK